MGGGHSSEAVEGGGGWGVSGGAGRKGGGGGSKAVKGGVSGERDWMVQMQQVRQLFLYATRTCTVIPVCYPHLHMHPHLYP